MSVETRTSLINTFLDSLKSLNPGVETAVVLIGSVARNAETDQSDLDLLVLADRPLETRRTADRLHVQAMEESAFAARLISGDDFAAWCVRFGIPLVRTSTWDGLVTSDGARTWPDWRQKIDHAARRLFLADELSRMGDGVAAQEELLYSISHIARAVLFKAGVFPLSRPEMIPQLGPAGYPKLGSLLDAFVRGNVHASTLRRGLLYSKKLLVHLDRSRFESHVLARKAKRKAKPARSRISQ